MIRKGNFNQMWGRDKMRVRVGRRRVNKINNFVQPVATSLGNQFGGMCLASDRKRYLKIEKMTIGRVVTFCGIKKRSNRN